MTEIHPSKSPLTVAAIIAAVALIYVLAEAPLFRITGRNRLPLGGVWRVWKPVDWLVDHTPVREPLSRWWELWDVGGEFYEAAVIRQGFHTIYIELQ